MLVVIRNGQRVEVPLAIEAEGAAAIEKHVTDKAGALPPPTTEEAPAEEAPAAPEPAAATRRRKADAAPTSTDTAEGGAS